MCEKAEGERMEEEEEENTELIGELQNIASELHNIDQSISNLDCSSAVDYNGDKTASINDCLQEMSHTVKYLR